MRETAAMFDLSAFCIFDIAGDGRARRRAARRHAADGRAGRPRRLHAAAHAGRRLPVRPDDPAARRRPLPRGHRRPARDGGPQVVPRQRGRRGGHRPHRAPGRRSACGGRGRATSSSSLTSDDVSHEGFPFARCRFIEIGPLQVLALRISYVGDLGWELHVPIEQGAAAVGHALGGRRAARRRPGRDRRLRHDGPDREGLPRLRLRARRRVRRGRGRHGVGQGQGPGLRRPRGAPAPPRVRAGGDHVHADRRRPHVGLRA